MAARAPLRKVGPKLIVILANLGIVKVVKMIRIVKIAIIKKVRMIISHNDHLMSKNIISHKGSPYHEDSEAHTLTTVPGVTKIIVKRTL